MALMNTNLRLNCKVARDSQPGSNASLYPRCSPRSSRSLPHQCLSSFTARMGIGHEALPRPSITPTTDLAPITIVIPPTMRANQTIATAAVQVQSLAARRYRVAHALAPLQIVHQVPDMRSRQQDMVVLTAFCIGRVAFCPPLYSGLGSVRADGLC